MKTVTCTDFRKRASDMLNQVEHGETLVIVRRGKPIAHLIPFTEETRREASWKQPGIRLQMQGFDLSSAIIREREEGR